MFQVDINFMLIYFVFWNDYLLLLYQQIKLLFTLRLHTTLLVWN